MAAPCGHGAVAGLPIPGEFEASPTQAGGGLDQRRVKPPLLPWSQYHGAVENPPALQLWSICRLARVAAEPRPGRQAVERRTACAYIKSLWMCRVVPVM